MHDLVPLNPSHVGSSVPASQVWLCFLASNGSASGKVGKPPCGALKRSIADSEESETYKSIFTSHSSAKRSKEESAHWVTHTSYCF